MDWNWFFSSVAQSVAALVGTLLAFAIARLLNSQAEFTRKISFLEELKGKAERLRDEAACRNFEWYNKTRMERALDRVRYQAKVMFNDASPDDFAKQFYFPEFSPRSEILRAIEQTLRKVEEDREEERREREAEAARERQRRSSLYGSLGDLTRMPDLSRLPGLAETARRQSEEDAKRDRLYEERETIKRLRVEVRDSIRNISMILASIANNPGSSPLVVRVLIGTTVLFSLGVIYPLSFLPLPPEWGISFDPRTFFGILFSIRGLILSLALAAYLAIGFILWQANASLVYDKETLGELKKWTSEEAYSQYLEVWSRNEADARNTLTRPAANPDESIRPVAPRVPL